MSRLEQGGLAPSSSWVHRLRGEVWVALVTAVALLIQAIIAKNVLDEELDVISQNAPLWVFIVFLLSGERGRAAEIGTAITVVAVSAAVLGLYAL